MLNKTLILLALADCIIIGCFTLFYLGHETFFPLYIGGLPFVLCNFIFVREFVAPRAAVTSQSKPEDRQAKKKSQWALFIMPVTFCINLPRLIAFDASLGWSPAVSFGFSILICLVIISFYGGVKGAMKSMRYRP